MSDLEAPSASRSDEAVQVPDVDLQLSPPKATMKSKVLQITIDMYQWICSTYFKEEDPDFSNISLGMQITEIILKSFVKKMRKIMAYPTPSSELYTVKHAEKTYNIPEESLDEAWSNIPKKYGLEFRAYELLHGSNWLRDIIYYLQYFTRFKLRFDELKQGHFMLYTEKYGLSLGLPVSNYGLNHSHHRLLEGCTYPTKKKHAMANYLGPLTLLLEYIRAGDAHRQKWFVACTKAMSHIPHIQIILKMLRGKAASEISAPMSHLADLLRFTVERRPLRIFLPLNCLAHLDLLMTEGYAIGQSTLDGMTFNHGTRNIFFGKINLDDGSVFLYTMLTRAGPYTLEGRWKETQAKQLIFHSIMGTYRETLKLLYWMTGENGWFPKFTETKTTPNTTFKLIPLVKYFKVVPGNTTKRCNYSNVVIPRTIQRISDEFFKSMVLDGEMSTGTNKAVQMNISQLTQYLITLKYEIGTMKDEGYDEMNCLEWHDIKGMTFDLDGPVIPCACSYKF